MRTLPIGPEEAFLLSRIDGASTVTDLAMMTGIEESRVDELLARLVQLGAVHGIDSAAVAEERPSQAPRAPRPAAAPQQVAIREVTVLAAAAPAALYDPSELDEDVEIDEQRKRVILDTFHMLDGATHYAVLGIAQDADKAAIKEAYFSLIGLYHPDKYFGKRLGSFKAKLERVFQRLTEAHDTLTRKKLRADYDEELLRRGVSVTTPLPRHPMTEVSGRAATEDRGRAATEGRAHDDRVDSAPPPSRISAPPPPRVAAPGAGQVLPLSVPVEERRSAPPAPPSHPPPAVSITPLDEEARRRMAARKLSGRPHVPTIPPPPSAPVDAVQVAEELRRRFENRLAATPAGQVANLLAAAEDSLARDNPVAAMNSLRVAATIAPNDPTVARKLAEVEQSALRSLADSYEERAKSEELRGDKAAAARAWERAAAGRPDSAAFHERAARCYLEAGVEPRKAVELARRAVLLEPNKAELRVTLARAYAKGGMRQSAEAEFDRAIKLAPNSDSVQTSYKRFKRGEL